MEDESSAVNPSHGNVPNFFSGLQNTESIEKKTMETLVLTQKIVWAFILQSFWLEMIEEKVFMVTLKIVEPTMRKLSGKKSQGKIPQECAP